MNKKVGKKLATYRAKRDFSITTEPAPDVPAEKSGDALTFMVHKHDATRLHYDLRLEMEGVLASWAVPKGPSYDTKERRLAVQTEDHPLAYGQFEGRIPDGEYGAGDSIIWDRGTWDTVPPGQATAMREKGHLVFELHGEKLRGRWHLVRTRSKDWLLFKGKDEHVSTAFDVVAERPESVVTGRRVTRGPIRAKTRDAPRTDPLKLLLKVWPPMLATLSDEGAIRKPEEWLLEHKYDGFRALAALSGGKVSLQSRNGLDLSARFPSIAKALSNVTVPEAVLDGEIVALDAHGVGKFQELQQSGSDSRVRASSGGAPNPRLRYFAFDLLWLDGEDLRERPVEERRDLLASVLANEDPPIVLAERVEEPLDEALESAREAGTEGLIAKRRGSRYSPDRSRDWLKLKVHAAQEFAIVGFSPISNGRHAIGALHLALWDGKALRWSGKVGTGFTDEVRRDLWRTLSKERVEKSAALGAPRARDAVWVEPRLVAQVEFTEWTADGKVRHPSFQGLREDKTVRECVREKAKPRRAGKKKPGPGTREGTATGQSHRTRWTQEDWVLP